MFAGLRLQEDKDNAKCRERGVNQNVVSVSPQTNGYGWVPYRDPAFLSSVVFEISFVVEIYA